MLRLPLEGTHDASWTLVGLEPSFHPLHCKTLEFQPNTYSTQQMRHFSSRVQERKNSYSLLQQEYEYDSPVFSINYLCAYNCYSDITETCVVAYRDV